MCFSPIFTFLVIQFFSCKFSAEILYNIIEVFLTTVVHHSFRSGELRGFKPSRYEKHSLDLVGRVALRKKRKCNYTVCEPAETKRHTNEHARELSFKKMSSTRCARCNNIVAKPHAFPYFFKDEEFWKFKYWPILYTVSCGSLELRPVLLLLRRFLAIPHEKLKQTLNRI